MPLSRLLASRQLLGPPSARSGPAVPAAGGSARTRASVRCSGSERPRRASIRPSPRCSASGGTTGIPKLIPRTHDDYLYNSKIAAAACEIGEGDVLLDVLPIEHNLPLGCPGLQGFLLSRRDRGAGHQHPAAGRVRADPAAPGDAHPPGARAADPVDRRPGDRRVRPVLAAGHPERRAAAAAGGQAARRTRPARLLHPGELRHGRGPDHVRPVVRPARSAPGDLRPAGLARRRGLPGGRGRERGARRRARRADRPRPVHAARLLPLARAQRAGVHPGRVLPLRRPAQEACRPGTTWSRAGSRT